MKTVNTLAVLTISFGLIGIFIACGTNNDGTGGYGAGPAGGAAGAEIEAGEADADALVLVEVGSNDVVPETVEDGCAKATMTANIKPAVMLFLIDRTGSMNCNAPPTQTSAECAASPVKKVAAEPSKWETTFDAFTGTVLPALSQTTPTPFGGISIFNNDDGCGFPNKPDVDVAELSNPQIQLIKLKLTTMNQPKGDTPIVGTMMRAYSYMQANASQFKGNPFIVLLTDGSESCDVPNVGVVEQKAKEATWIGIRTFVLGAPGSEDSRAFLSRLAFNGGTAKDPDQCDHHDGPDNPDKGNCHLDMTTGGNFKADLQAALAEVSGKALSCEFDVPKSDGGPVDPDHVNVVYKPGEGFERTIPQDTGCVSPDSAGWEYTDDSNTKIQLCGGLCDQVKKDPSGSVSIILGCMTVVI